MTWTQDRINLLVKLWLEGKSATTIASELGNISRNAVIGKVHRLGISNRDTASKEALSKEISIKKAIKSKKTIKATKNQSENKHIIIKRPTEKKRKTKNYPEKTGVLYSVLDLNDKVCRWPIGHPDEDGFHFCGCQKTNSSSPYCDKHMEIAYTQSIGNKTSDPEDSSEKTEKTRDNIVMNQNFPDTEQTSYI